MSRGESNVRSRTAQRLRAQGKTYGQIAADLGVSITTVQRLCKPDYAERHRAAARAWKDRNREAYRESDRHAGDHPCPDCGSRASRSGERCQSCAVVRNQATMREIQRLWLDGLTLPEIAARVNTTVNTIGTTMVRMRKLGWDLPYRYRFENGRRVAA